MSEKPGYKSITAYLKAVRCHMGEECKQWIAPHYCLLDGFVEIRGRAQCQGFTPDYNHLMEELHEEVNKMLGKTAR